MDDCPISLPPRLRINPETGALMGASETELKTMCMTSVARRRIRAAFKKKISVRELDPIDILKGLPGGSLFEGKDEEEIKAIRHLRVREFLRAIPAVGAKKCAQFMTTSNIQRNPTFNWLAQKNQILSSLIADLEAWSKQYNDYRASVLEKNKKIGDE